MGITGQAAVLEAAELGAAAAAELLRVVPAEAVGDVLVEQAVAEVVGAGDELVVGEEWSSEDESDRESDFADLDADPEYPGLLSRLRAELSH